MNRLNSSKFSFFIAPSFNFQFARLLRTLRNLPPCFRIAKSNRSINNQLRQTVQGTKSVHARIQPAHVFAKFSTFPFRWFPCVAARKAVPARSKRNEGDNRAAKQQFYSHPRTRDRGIASLNCRLPSFHPLVQGLRQNFRIGRIYAICSNIGNRDYSLGHIIQLIDLQSTCRQSAPVSEILLLEPDAIGGGFKLYPARGKSQSSQFVNTERITSSGSAKIF